MVYSAPVAPPTCRLFCGREGYWLPTSLALGPQDIVAAERITAVQGKAVIEDVEDFQGGIIDVHEGVGSRC